MVERFGVLPEKVVDVQALAGDSTDNVPGVPGIGIKTAAELINLYGDLETLLASAEEIKQPKRRENLINFAEQARISRQLVLLRDDAPTPIALGDLRRAERDMDRLKAFLLEQDFKRLFERIGVPGDPTALRGTKSVVPAIRSMAVSPSQTVASISLSAADQPFETISYKLICDVAALSTFLDRARQQGYLAVDTETTGLNAAAADLVGISMALAPGDVCYVPLRHGAASPAHGQEGLDFSALPDQASPQIAFDEAMALIRPIFEDPSVLKIGHNLKYDAHILMQGRNGGIALAPVDDTMCLSYVLDGGRVERHSIDFLARHWMDHQTIKFEDVCGKGAKQVPFNAISPEAALNYAAEDADITLRLWQLLKPRLAGEGVVSVYERLERPLIPVLARMENKGITVDRSILARMSNDFAARMGVLQSEIMRLAG